MRGRSETISSPRRRRRRGGARAPAARRAAGGGDLSPGIGSDVEGLAMDGAGRLYVADFHANRVVVLGPAGDVASVIGAGALDRPVGVAIAPGGDVLVADSAGVRRFAADGTAIAAGRADAPAGIAVGADGTVYISEPDDVARFTGTGA